MSKIRSNLPKEFYMDRVRAEDAHKSVDIIVE